jgi:hypothetical protein
MNWIKFPNLEISIVKFTLLIQTSVLCLFAQPIQAQQDEIGYIHSKEKIIVTELISQENQPNLSRHAPKLTWIGRIEYLDRYCLEKSSPFCKEALSQGLQDKALVVRDHALKKIVKRELLEHNEKKRLLGDVVKDQRNYRKGRALWIVDRAKVALSDLP